MNSPAFRPAPHAPLDAANIAPAIDNPAANRLAPSVGSTAWGQALGEKIVWMAAGAQQTASLTLNPPNLGPLQVVLHVSNDQATASFFSAQPEVRQALETAFPRLREMMNDAGIQLGEATVSADTPRQNDTPERQAQRGAPFIPPFIGGNDAASSGLQTAQGAIRQSGRGLIDTFA
jgi:flagellar hook-length control protein FliK